MSKRLCSILRAAALLLLFASSAQAQYKWISPDGTVGYGDRPPPPGARIIDGLRGTATPAGSAEAALPYALRTAVARFPVTLYTTPRCEPCDLGRAHLKKRGIPFAERTIVTQADVDVLKKLGSSGEMLPVLGVGNERTDGYESGSWDRLLDAGGFPKSSMLPSNYKAPAPQVLAERSAGAKDSAGAQTKPPGPGSGVTESRSAEDFPRTEFVASSGPPLRLPGMPNPQSEPVSRVRF